MSLDLEARLRDYGTDIDSAVETTTIRDAAPGPTRSRWVRYGVPAAAAAMVAVATGVLIAGRGPERSGPAAGVPESTVAGPGIDYQVYFSPGDWEFVEPDQLAPVVLADGIVPIYSLTDEATARFDGGMFPGSGYWLLACTAWDQADDGSVNCSAVESDDVQPTAIYSGDDGRVVKISTSNDASVDAVNFASRLWREANTQTISAEPEQVDVDGDEAWYAEEGTSAMLVWSPAADAVVAIESQGFTREEVFELTRSVVPVPTDLLPNIPLVLARSAPPDAFPPWVRDDRVVGALSDGEVCAFASDHILGDDSDQCLALNDDPMLLTVHGQGAVAGRYGGLVNGDVDLIRLDFEDGTEFTLRPTPQPVGDVQAFATKVNGPPATTITALDADGNELMTIDVASLNEQLTASFDTEPAKG